MSEDRRLILTERMPKYKRPVSDYKSIDIAITEYKKESGPIADRLWVRIPTVLVRKTGLEPVRCEPHAPQTCASASSATSASHDLYILSYTAAFVNTFSAIFLHRISSTAMRFRRFLFGGLPMMVFLNPNNFHRRFPAPVGLRRCSI